MKNVKPSARGLLIANSGRLLAVCTSAVLIRLTVPPFDWCVVAPIAWVPLIASTHGLSFRNTLMWGCAHGVAVNLLGFGWIWGVLRETAHVGWVNASLALAALIVMQGFRSVAVVLCTHALVRRGQHLVPSFVLALVSMDLWYPMFFPWDSSALVAAAPIWCQAAEWGGPLAISLWLAIVNGALASGVIDYKLGKSARSAMTVAVTTIAAMTTLGFVRMGQVDAASANASTLNIGVVQGNLAPAHVETQDPVPVHRAETLKLLQHSPKLDVVIWPETAIFQPVRESDLYWFLREHVLKDPDTKARIDVPLLTGVNLIHDNTASNSRTNSALLIHPRASIMGRYDKRQLLPVVETALLPDLVHQILGLKEGPEIPTRLPILRAGSERQAPIHLGETAILTTICYEEIFASKMREHALNQGAGLLLTLSSDSWFGDTPAAALHLTLSRLRAIEQRKYFLRATTTGLTVMIDPAGRVTWGLPSNTRSAGVVAVKMLPGTTTYGKWGNGSWYLAIAAYVVFILGRELRFGFQRTRVAGKLTRQCGAIKS